MKNTILKSVIAIAVLSFTACNSSAEKKAEGSEENLETIKTITRENNFKTVVFEDDYLSFSYPEHWELTTNYNNENSNTYLFNLPSDGGNKVYVYELAFRKKLYETAFRTKDDVEKRYGPSEVLHSEVVKSKFGDDAFYLEYKSKNNDTIVGFKLPINKENPTYEVIGHYKFTNKQAIYDANIKTNAVVDMIKSITIKSTETEN